MTVLDQLVSAIHFSVDFSKLHAWRLIDELFYEFNRKKSSNQLVDKDQRPQETVKKHFNIKEVQVMLSPTHSRCENYIKMISNAPKLSEVSFH